MSSVWATPLPLVTGEWEPYTASKLEKMGFFTALVQAAMQAAGLENSVGFYSWSRNQFLVESGQAFAAFPYAVTRARSQYAYFSDVIHYGETVFFYKPALHPEVHFDNLSDLKKYRLAGARGFFYEEIFKHAQLQPMIIDHEVDLLKLLDLDKVDIIPMDAVIGWNYIHKLYPEKAHEFSTLPKYLNKDGLYLMVSKKYPNAENILKEFNQGLQRIKDDGTYLQIQKEFLSQNQIAGPVLP